MKSKQRMTQFLYFYLSTYFNFYFNSSFFVTGLTIF